MKYRTLLKIYCQGGFNGYMWQLALEDIRTQIGETK